MKTPVVTSSDITRFIGGNHAYPKEDFGGILFYRDIDSPAYKLVIRPLVHIT